MSDPDGPSYWDHPDDRDEAWPPRESPGASPVTEDTPALLAYAASVRGIAWSTQLGAAMDAAASAHWPWKRAAGMAHQLLLDDDSEPRMLTEATRDPLRRARSASVPPAEWRQARAELDRKAAGAA
jgi:hypothetical protein